MANISFPVFCEFCIYQYKFSLIKIGNRIARNITSESNSIKTFLNIDYSILLYFLFSPYNARYK